MSKAGTALVRRDRPQEKTQIERRRAEVGRLGFSERLPESQIVARLAKLDPPILIIRSTVSHDIEHVRGTYRRVFRQGGFDPRAAAGLQPTSR